MGYLRNNPTKQVGRADAGHAPARRASETMTRPASAALVCAALCLLLSGPGAAQTQTPTPGPDARTHAAAGAGAPNGNGNGRGDGRPEPDAAGGATEETNLSALLSETDTRGAAMHRRLLDYTYTLKKVRRELNERGGTKEEEADTFEAYPIRGEHLLVRISKNGRESPGWLVERERQNVGRALQQLEEATAKDAEATAALARPRWMAVGVGGRVRGKPVYVVVDPAEFLHSCEFYAQRRERVAGRDTIVFDFRPRPGAALPPSKSYLSSLVGTAWIDAADMAIVRIEARPAAGAVAAQPAAAVPSPGSDAQPQRASLVLYQQTRLSSGVWAPTLIRINSGGDAALFGGLNWDVVLEFSDYKEFSTGVQSIEFPPPAAPARP
jgi:hypothetical protein